MRVLPIVGALFILVSGVSAQQADSDTARTYKLKEVIVTATRSSISVKDSPSPVDVIDIRRVQNTNGNTVADVLQNYSSVFVRNYGASAALKTVSLRGTASEHLLVLVNGNRLNSFQNGLVDFSLIPLNDIERIEIVHSGSSALYGADALGGVVNILTRQASSSLRLRAEIAAGSFGFQRYFLESQGRVDRLGLLAGYSSERGRDDFPFHLQKGSLPDATMHRANSDFQRRQVYLHGNIETDDRSAITFSAQHVLADRGVSGSILFPTDVARQNDKDLSLLVGYLDSHLSSVEFNIKTAFHYNLETYADPTFLINSYYKNIFVNLNPQIQLLISKNERLIIGGELGRGLLYGNDFDGRISRMRKSMYVSNEIQFDFDRAYLDRLSLYQTLRYDDISDVDHALTPKFGVNLRLFKEGDVRLRASVGRNFRAPSFNDMYYRGFSNPNLKPERSTSYDVGVLAGGEYFGEHTIELTYFHLNTENRILFDPTTYLPVNIGKARSEGIEAKYQGHFLKRIIDLGLNYTLADARKINRNSDIDPSFDKKLLYIPKDVAAVTLSVLLEPLTLNFTHSLVGRRYIKEDNSESLPPYHLTHANIVLSAPIGSRKLFAKAEVNNLFDRDYEVFQYYPMPKRSYSVTLGAEY